MRGDDGFDPIIVVTGAATREILTVRTESTAEQSAFFDPDPVISPTEASKLLEAVAEALKTSRVRALTLSGSSPAEATHEVYSELIALARARRVPVFLDTYGPALRAIWGFWPDVMQVNRREAGVHLGVSDPSDRQVAQMLDGWVRHGVRAALVTDGPRPILARVSGRAYRVTPPVVEPVNPIGSGDCLLAGLTNGWLSGLEGESLLRHGVACAVANALTWDAGAIDPALVQALESQVTITQV
jgi:fructose-1-phosphate kinase PfkB-like protein